MKIIPRIVEAINAGVGIFYTDVSIIFKKK